MIDSITSAEITTHATPASPAASAVTPGALSKPAPKAVAKPAAKKAAAPARKPVVGLEKKAAPAKSKVKVAAKPIAKASTQNPAKPTAKPVAKAIAKQVAIPTAKAVAKPVKEKKLKMVRDSISIPKTEYVVLEAMKLRAGKLAMHIKKTELIRAGIKALSALGDAGFLAALRAVPSLKTGRPSKNA
jgi:hypothetical protein